MMPMSVCREKAHASFDTVFKDPSASEEMATVQRMNASHLITFFQHLCYFV